MIMMMVDEVLGIGEVGELTDDYFSTSQTNSNKQTQMHQGSRTDAVPFNSKSRQPVLLPLGLVDQNSN